MCRCCSVRSVTARTEARETTINAETAEHAETTVNAEAAEHAETTINAETAEHAETTISAETAEHAKISRGTTVNAEAAEHAETTISAEKCCRARKDLFRITPTQVRRTWEVVGYDDGRPQGIQIVTESLDRS